MDQNIETILKKISLLKSTTKIFDTYFDTYIYGVGSMSKDIYHILTRLGLPVAGFLDHRIPERSPMHGVPVYQPGELAGTLSDIEKVRILLAIHNPYADIAEISKQLKRIGFRQVLTMVDIFDELGDELGERYWLAKRNFYADFIPLIESTNQLLADETSRSLFAAVLEFRLSGDYSRLSELDQIQQYFPDDLPPWNTPIRLIDCGAFTGDTIASFIESGQTLSAVAAFEPDLNNFSKLSKYIEVNRESLPQTTLWPCGVYSSTKQLRFGSGQAGASTFLPAGDSIVQCVSLDDVLPNFAPTLIKMDIEGAEYEALLGATKVIQTYRPGLAISIYHRPQDLWQIPLLIAQMVFPKLPRANHQFRDGQEPYKYYLRLHNKNGFDLIFYAIPN